MYKQLQDLSLKDAIKILHDTQKYRRGKKGQMPHTSKEFGVAIDFAIRELRKVLKKENEEK